MSCYTRKSERFFEMAEKLLIMRAAQTNTTRVKFLAISQDDTDTISAAAPSGAFSHKKKASIERTPTRPTKGPPNSSQSR
mmetsp:Transcript_4446/g.12567  ORF Transcript_4446/g.12567 Transcript_4446/m.12567 type:complete len:80 (-) Transcript_4446:618-857(-)